MCLILVLLGLPQAPPLPQWLLPPPPAVKSCPCSPECVCGCNEGEPCDCGVSPPPQSRSWSVPPAARRATPRLFFRRGG
jgi:hypothetical protein